MPTRTLVIGGTGFVSGTLARRAVELGHQVWIVTRGRRPAPPGVRELVADRHQRDAFEHAIAAAGTTWDLVVDCIGYEPEDARQDIATFASRADHLVFISTDFVFDPGRRTYPQDEGSQHFADAGYGGGKRRCELELSAGATGSMGWTVLRPCHIYGPGSQLGCLPLHGRDPELLHRLRHGAALRLVGGGHFLQQPVFAPDLADVALSCLGNARAASGVFCTAGPEIIESRTYYEIIADCLGVGLRVEEVPVDQSLAERPQLAPFLCHRIYDLSRLRAAGLPTPSTPLRDGLRTHVASMPHL